MFVFWIKDDGTLGILGRYNMLLFSLCPGETSEGKGRCNQRGVRYILALKTGPCKRQGGLELIFITNYIEAHDTEEVPCV